MKTIKRLRDYFLYDTKLAVKFSYLLVLLLLAEIVVTNVYIRSNASRLLTDEVCSSSQQFLEQYVDNIGYRLSKFNTLLSGLSGNETLIDLLSADALAQEDYEQLDREIRKALEAQFPYGFYDLALYPAAKCQPGISSLIKPPEMMPEQLRLYAQDAENFNRYFLYREAPYQTQLLTTIKPVYGADGRLLCTIKLSLFPDKVFKSVRNVHDAGRDQVFLITSEGDYYYGEQPEEMSAYLDFLHTKYGRIYNGLSVEAYYAKKGIYLTSTKAALGLHAVYCFSYATSLESVNSLNQTLILGFFFFMLLALIACTLISATTNRRFSAVLEKVKTAAEGNLKIADAHPGRDEICIFDQSFTQMVRKVDSLIVSNYVMEMKKKDAELMALQAQINPHFLFNSLETINSLIEIGQYDTACEGNACLSRLLRYSINRDSSGIVTIGEEISHMKNYLYMQNLRFRTPVSFHESVQAHCLENHIIKLIFQPIVENSIRHGFSKNASRKNIWFSLSEEQGRILIEIRDDGDGMAQEDYGKLLKRLEDYETADFQTQNDSVGLLNIHHRLKLKYGEAYELSLSTAPGRGMTVFIKIPKQ